MLGAQVALPCRAVPHAAHNQRARRGEARRRAVPRRAVPYQVCGRPNNGFLSDSSRFANKICISCQLIKRDNVFLHGLKGYASDCCQLEFGPIRPAQSSSGSSAENATC